MSIGVDSLTNSGGMKGGDATSGVNADVGGAKFSRTFGNIGGFSVQWWVWVIVAVALAWYLWKSKK